LPHKSGKKIDEKISILLRVRGRVRIRVRGRVGVRVK
jgi:hypothetical protein